MTNPSSSTQKLLQDSLMLQYTVGWWASSSSCCLLHWSSLKNPICSTVKCSHILLFFWLIFLFVFPINKSILLIILSMFPIWKRWFKIFISIFVYLIKHDVFFIGFENFWICEYFKLFETLNSLFEKHFKLLFKNYFYISIYHLLSTNLNETLFHVN